MADPKSARQQAVGRFLPLKPVAFVLVMPPFPKPPDALKNRDLKYKEYWEQWEKDMDTWSRQVFIQIEVALANIKANAFI